MSEDYEQLVESIYSYYMNNLPTSIFGLNILREREQHDIALQLDSWLFSSTDTLLASSLILVFRLTKLIKYFILCTMIILILLKICL